MQLAMPSKATPSRLRILLPLFLLLAAATAGGIYWHVTGTAVFQGRADVLSLALAPDIPGTVSKVAVREGDTVQEGQALVFLDAAALRTRLAQEEDKLARLEASLPAERLPNGPRGGESGALQSDGGRWETQAQTLARQMREEETAGHALREASAAEAQAAFVYNRASILAAQGKLSQGQKDAARQAGMAAGEARARAKTYFETVSLARASTEADIRRILALQKQTGVDEVPANLRIKAYEAQLARTQEAAALFEAAVLRAPHEGVVVSVAVKPGMAVTAGQPAVYMLPTDAPLTVLADVTQQAAAGVRKGMACTVDIPASPHSPFTGRVQAILPRVRPANANATEMEAFRRASLQIRILLDSQNTTAPDGKEIKDPMPLLLPDNTPADITVHLRSPLTQSPVLSKTAVPGTPKAGMAKPPAALAPEALQARSKQEDSSAAPALPLPAKQNALPPEGRTDAQKAAPAEVQQPSLFSPEQEGSTTPAGR